MEVIVKKTIELNDEEKQALLDCFIEVFDQKRSMKEMCNQYLNTPMGYCIHSLCFDDRKLIAAHTAFPSYYWIGEKRVKAFITGDTMVKKDYRDGFVFLDIVKALGKYMKQEGYSFTFGFPNDHSYPVFKKVKLAKDIGRLDTFILPYRIGGVKPGLKLLNPLSKVFCHLLLAYSRWNLHADVSSPFIHKDDVTYNPKRYNRMDGYYNHVVLTDTEFYYKVKNHEGVRTAFLIDVIGKSETRFYSAVKHIFNTERDRFDLLMYVGNLPKSVNRIGLIKFPRKYEPKHFYMTGMLYDKEIVSEKLFYDISNWDVNLSDYDII